jgi:hypothetical protein
MATSRLRVCLAVAASVAFPDRSSALNPRTLISQYTADHWSAKDGLPQASVGAIAETTDGYIWLATEEGLSPAVVGPLNALRWTRGRSERT